MGHDWVTEYGKHARRNFEHPAWTQLGQSLESAWTEWGMTGWRNMGNMQERTSNTLRIPFNWREMQILHACFPIRCGGLRPHTVSLINPVSLRIDHHLHTPWKAVADTVHIILLVDVTADVAEASSKLFGRFFPRLFWKRHRLTCSYP